MNHDNLFDRKRSILSHTISVGLESTHSQLTEKCRHCFFSPFYFDLPMTDCILSLVFDPPSRVPLLLWLSDKCACVCVGQCKFMGENYGRPESPVPLAVHTRGPGMLLSTRAEGAKCFSTKFTHTRLLFCDAPERVKFQERGIVAYTLRTLLMGFRVVSI